MTAGARPNLGGLFNGSTPPQKLNGSALRPKLILSTPLGGQDEPTIAGREPTTTGSESASSTRTAEFPRSTGAGWLDPVNAVERYFGFLQTLLDTNRALMVALATTVSSLPTHLGKRP